MSRSNFIRNFWPLTFPTLESDDRFERCSNLFLFFLLTFVTLFATTVKKLSLDRSLQVEGEKKNLRINVLFIEELSGMKLSLLIYNMVQSDTSMKNFTANENIGNGTVFCIAVFPFNGQKTIKHNKLSHRACVCMCVCMCICLRKIYKKISKWLRHRYLLDLDL